MGRQADVALTRDGRQRQGSRKLFALDDGQAQSDA